MNEKVFLDLSLTQGITRNFCYIFVPRAENRLWDFCSEASIQEPVVQPESKLQNYFTKSGN